MMFGGPRPRMEGSKFFPRVPRPSLTIKAAREMATLEAERIERRRREKIAVVEIHRIIAREAAANLAPAGAAFRLTLRDLLAGVCLVRGLAQDEVLSDRRWRQAVEARQEFMWLARRYTTLSLPRIGYFLGGRDHTTVMHGIRRHQARIDAARAKRRGG